MKKVIVYSAALVLIGVPAMAQSAQGFRSQQFCQNRTHGTCVQQGSVWVPASSGSAPAAAPATPAAPAPAPATASSTAPSSASTTGSTATTSTGTTSAGSAPQKSGIWPWSNKSNTAPPAPSTTTTVTQPATPATPAAPAAASATPPSTPKKSGWFGGGSSGGAAETPNAVEQNKPDPKQIARSKVYGSQGECQSGSGGNCRSVDCATHLGGVCEHNKGVVWTFAGEGGPR